MSNILKALVNIVNNYQVNVSNVINGNNRANNMGEGLETYIKDAFSGTFLEVDKKKKKEKFRDNFSYEGSKTRIPDLILKNGDAIEIKKTEVLGDLQLNSSHPKAILKSNYNLSAECKNCEEQPWIQKDIIYAMGHIPKDSKILKSLWFVYGTCYAANEEVYKEVISEVKNALKSSDKLDIDLECKELAKVKNIDSLKITYLRVRGMWVIKHPSKIYDDLYKQTNEIFSLVAIIPIDKYNSFPKEDRNIIENIDSVSITDEKISDPNNAANTIDIKLILFKVTQ
ncbi:restriction endonuclease [Arcobacter sp. CECT 8983]|uniref:NgoPII family restriction endonuclease n=1 Tax=Arcobacter sp. CECT 8983 TaxID=2044508 RepID=UPI00100B6111|nr:NgoPII family restriction endonuclease [Arcobacter sp. CECT 8983]RXJ89005.1 restriction endonuclease [Arcobacter sp. CECT 8983]